MLFIFDWDGTVSDSTGKIVACMQAAAAEMKLPYLADAQVKEIIGLSLMRAAAQLYPQLSEADHKRLCDSYSRHYLASDHLPSGLYPNVRETLEVLHNNGHQLAVATGKSRKGLERVFGSLAMRELFHGSRCADETESKPSPLMLFELLEEFGIPAKQAVMIGDTEFDMEMAMRAAMPRIGVSYGAHAAERLHKYDLALCMDCMSELLPWAEVQG